MAQSRADGDRGESSSSGRPRRSEDEWSSGYEQSILSTRSVTSSVFNYHKENGRTYHGYHAGSYHFPNDATEVERLEYQHLIMDHVLDNKLFFAPIPTAESLKSRPPYDPMHPHATTPSLNILDIGCGAGNWAIDMGDLYPSALIEGTDLSPIQPTCAPPNVFFIIDDASQSDWAVPDNHYDYIHERILAGSFESFGDILKTAFKHLKEGGWMESQEVDIIARCDDESMAPDWPFLKWCQLICETSAKCQRPLDITAQLKQWYEEAGFVDVKEVVYKIPIGRWEEQAERKDLGRWWMENLLNGLQGFSLALLHRELDWSRDKIEYFLVNVRKSLKDKNVRAYNNCHVVIGRKPTKEEMAEKEARGRGKHPQDESGSDEPASKKSRSPAGEGSETKAT